MFSLLGTNGGYITSVAFRLAGNAFGNTNSFTYPMMVSLSSTPLAVNSLHGSFVDNLGADNQVVYSSNWNMGVFPRPNSLLEFHYVIPFSTPFFYNPTNGNLLLDIQITTYVNTNSGAGPAILDYNNYPGMCRVFGFGNESTPAPTNGGVFTSSGLLTEFGVTPVSSPSYRIGKFAIIGGQIICGSTNGAAGVVYTVLTSTNLATSNWVPVGSNVFDANGSFLFTNSVATTAPRQFYILNLPTN